MRARGRGLDEWFEIAEEIAQLEHFAAGIEKGRFDAASRKEMRDQSYQARARGRSDLAQRGVAGGSARDLDPVRTVDRGVELACYREGGKLRMRVVSDGYAFLVEMLYEAHRRGCRIGEVPIIFVERRIGQSKMSSSVILESAYMPWQMVLRGLRAKD